MWIKNKYGVAINTDSVARFRTNECGEVIADLQGIPQTTSATIIGATTVEEIIANIISGTKLMEVE